LRTGRNLGQVLTETGNGQQAPGRWPEPPQLQEMHRNCFSSMISLG
jgi:hypothetical protein